MIDGIYLGARAPRDAEQSFLAFLGLAKKGVNSLC